jgi:thioredoxin 1
VFKSDSPVEALTTQAQVEALMSPQGGAAIIDFWSQTCGPCQAVGPVVEAVAAQYAGQPVRFCHINTGRQTDLMVAFRIQSVPTFMFVLNGEIVDVYVGKIDGPGLVSRVEGLLSRARGEGFWHRLLGIKKRAPQA